jgi:CDP-diacylglycerol pyrophosphatase
VAALVALSACAALAVTFDRGALWQVVQACVADAKLTGAPFPCLDVDLEGGEERGFIILRSPLTGETILAPTRPSVGVEDPFLQSPEAPNYFAAAWRGRSFLVSSDGKAPQRDQVALIVNSRPVRVQDQLHIHIGCLRPRVQRFLDQAAPTMPLGELRLIGPVIPHQVFWGMRLRSRDLTDVEPFRIVFDRFGKAIPNPADLTIIVAGAPAADDDGFLILVTYAHAPGSWWPVGAEELLARRCPAAPQASGRPD